MDVEQFLKEAEEAKKVHEEVVEMIRQKYAPQENKPQAPKKEENSKAAKKKEELKYLFLLIGLGILCWLVLYWLV